MSERQWLTRNPDGTNRWATPEETAQYEDRYLRLSELEKRRAELAGRELAGVASDEELSELAEVMATMKEEFKKPSLP